MLPQVCTEDIRSAAGTDHSLVIILTVFLPFSIPVKPISTGFHMLYRTGDQPGDSPLPIGTLTDQHGKAIMTESGVVSDAPPL